MIKFNTFLDEKKSEVEEDAPGMATGAVAGAGDDSSTVIVKNRRKRRRVDLEAKEIPEEKEEDLEELSSDLLKRYADKATTRSAKDAMSGDKDKYKKALKRARPIAKAQQKVSDRKGDEIVKKVDPTYKKESYELEEGYEKITPGVKHMAQRVHDAIKKGGFPKNRAHQMALDDSERALHHYHGKDWRKRLGVKESVDEALKTDTKIKMAKDKLVRQMKKQGKSQADIDKACRMNFPSLYENTMPSPEEKKRAQDHSQGKNLHWGDPDKSNKVKLRGFGKEKSKGNMDSPAARSSLRPTKESVEITEAALSHEIKKHWQKCGSELKKYGATKGGIDKKAFQDIGHMFDFTTRVDDSSKGYNSQKILNAIFQNDTDVRDKMMDIVTNCLGTKWRSSRPSPKEIFGKYMVESVGVSADRKTVLVTDPETGKLVKRKVPMKGDAGEKKNIQQEDYKTDKKNAPFDGAKKRKDTKNSDGSDQKGSSRAKSLAKRGMKTFESFCTERFKAGMEVPSDAGPDGGMDTSKPVKKEAKQGTAAKYADKKGFMGKYSSHDHIHHIKDSEKQIKRRRDKRDAEHKAQDPRMAKRGYAQNIVDRDKAQRKAKKKGLGKQDINWRQTNSAQDRKLPESTDPTFSRHPANKQWEEGTDMKANRLAMIRKAAERIKAKEKQAAKRAAKDAKRGIKKDKDYQDDDM